MNIVKKWCETSLVLRIFVGLVIGAILGLTVPNLTGFELLGTIFVGALKAIAPVLVFVLILSSLANSGEGIGARFKTVICLYLLSTLVAAIIAVIASFAFPVTMKLSVDAADNAAPSGIVEVLENLLTNMVSNPVTSVAEASYVSILFWAVVLGLCLKKVGHDTTKTVVADFADMVSSAVRFVIQLAPFGILGLVFKAVAESGLAVFTTYGKLVAVLVGCMLLVALVVDPIIVGVCLGRNPYPLVLTCLKESGLTAFFTRSSAANIPVNMSVCEKLGLEKDFYSVSIPLGATINMDGAAIVITIMSLSVAHTVGVAVDLPTAIMLCFLSTLAACGASGVAGGSLLLIPMACSLFGIDNDVAMQAVAVGFIISVIQDSLETALNSSGDVMFAATAEYRDRAKRGEDMQYLGAYAKKED